MKKHILCLFLGVLSLPLLAQLRDNIWVVGYPSGFEPFGTTVFTFYDGSLKVARNNISYINFQDNNAAISSEDGELLAYFNGMHVEDGTFNWMKNGDRFNKQIIEWIYYLSDDDLPQGSLFLPWPGHPDSLLLLYHSQGDVFDASGERLGLASLDLTFAIIDMMGNNGKGEVVQKAIPLLKDTVQYGRLTAAKHANGRDWWILVQEVYQNRFYRILLDPQGFHVVGSQEVPIVLRDGFGQAVFSPDGSKFASYNGIRVDEGYLYLFDFDRCTGLLSNAREHQYTKGYVAGGLSVSSNSRFMYLSLRDTIFQYDLQASDVWASRLMIDYYNGFGDPFPAAFYQGQIGPDRRIYITATNGTQYMHVVEKPDKPGLACGFRQHGLKLPRYYYASVPNFPNFRLGALDGSPCDTLGLDNVPVAWYRYEQDTLDPLAVAFTDLSHHEPAEWYWDFGDGSLLSRDTSPAHVFPDKGQYKVCLTVRNQYGTHTHCKTLYLGVSAQDNPVLQAQIQVSPNPFSERLAVALSAPELRGAAFRLFDATGRLVREMGLEYGINEVEAGNLAKGLYFWAVEQKGERVKSGKVVKM